MATKKSSTKRRPARPSRYPAEFRLRAVKLYLEEEYPSRVLCEELGIGHSTLNKWVKRFREEDEAGLEGRPMQPKMNPSKRGSPRVKAKVVELKKEDPKRERDQCVLKTASGL